MEGESTPGITGYLEVTVNGDLVHSKKGGDGYVDSEAKLKKIKDAISAKLKYRRLSEELTDEFGDDIKMEGESTDGVSGYLEVTVDGDLVHSKKNGDGYVDSEAKLKKITDAISAKLK